jgi:peptidoglycan/xylan/chitin deacetylase (PgdA/CDA1 family)
MLNLLRLKYIRLLNKFLSLFYYLHQQVSINKSYIYLFHEILEKESQLKNELEISVHSFEKFLNYQLIKENISNKYSDLTNHILNKKILKDKSYIITFDDAFESVYSLAWPLLKKYNISFIVFVTVELIGKKSYLSESQILELSKCPLCTIGSHGVNHVPFQRIIWRV